MFYSWTELYRISKTRPKTRNTKRKTGVIATLHTLQGYQLCFDKSDHGVSVKDAYNKLPIQVLLFEADCDRDSLDFVEAVGRLLYANPMNPADLVNDNDDL